MNRANDNQVELEITNYLLGEMSDEEQTKFEIRYLADDSMFEQMLLVKQELIDAYVRHHLDAGTSEKFERHFLATPEGQKEVALASALREKLNQPSLAIPVKSPVFPRPTWFGSWSIRQIGFTAASLLLLAGAGWLLIDNRKLRRELSALQIERADIARREEALRQQLAQLTAPNPAPTPLMPAPPEDHPGPISELLAINLMPTSRTGEQNVQTVKLPARPLRPSLNLKLNFEPVRLRCLVRLQMPDGNKIELRNLPARPHPQGGYSVQAQFTTVLLKAGQYEATVSAHDADNNEQREVTYRFRVEISSSR